MNLRKKKHLPVLLYLLLQSNRINHPVTSQLVEWIIRSTQGKCNTEITWTVLMNMKQKIPFFVMALKNIYIKQTNFFAGNICSSFNACFYVMFLNKKNSEMKIFQKTLCTNKLYKLHWKTFQILVWAPKVHNGTISKTYHINLLCPGFSGAS